MKKAFGWTLGAFTILILLAILLGSWGWGWRGGWSGWRMHGPGMMWGFAPFSWLGMFFMILIPLGFLILSVLGIAWLVRVASGSTAAPLIDRSCPNCGKKVQPDWQNCPYCGTPL